MDNPEEYKEIRLVMKEYWDIHSQDASLQEMMLDTNAEELMKYEMPEIMSHMPNYHNKDVIELGAGIGRFSGIIAQEAKTVLAVDFVEKFIIKNRKLNAKHNNLQCLCADVMDLKLPNNSYDLVFSNWLFMYLKDEELHELLISIMSWLRDGGYMFCRESCRFPSGNMERNVNPTNYREPSAYDVMFSSAAVTIDGVKFGFDMITSKRLETYVKMKNNENQMIWVVQKVRRD